MSLTDAAAEDILIELGAEYAAYREALTCPFDSIITLRTTGNILACVRRLLVLTGHATDERAAKNIGVRKGGKDD